MQDRNKRFKMWLGHLFPGFKLFFVLMAIEVIYALIVIWFDEHFIAAQKLKEANGAMMTSALLGLLLALRTNSAYDRWWEGRKLWGQLVNDCRNLAIKLRSRVSDADELKELARLIIAFPYALRNHLRSEPPDARLSRLGFEKPQPHLPLYVAGLLGDRIEKLRRDNTLNDWQLLLLDPHVRALMDISGGCERILSSPISGAYKNMIWLGLGTYLLSLPWLLAPTLDEWTILFVISGTYFVVGLELIAEEVERPFGHEVNDLPLTSICVKIEQAVSQVVGHEFESGPNADQYAATH